MDNTELCQELRATGWLQNPRAPVQGHRHIAKPFGTFLNKHAPTCKPVIPFLFGHFDPR